MSFEHNQFPAKPTPPSNEIFFDASSKIFSGKDFHKNSIKQAVSKTEKKILEGAKLNKRLAKTLEFAVDFP